MRAGIDASNLRAGGARTHLIEILQAADARLHGFEEIIVWAGSAVLAQIPDRPWLRKVPQALLEQASNPYRDLRHLYRAYWQCFRLRKLARDAGCHVLFVPGGMDNSGFHPNVTMSRNMLPFDRKEARRYRGSLARLRLWILRGLQTRTFRNADGLIFLTEYARRSISRMTDIDLANTTVVPHGVSRRFRRAPRIQKGICEYSDTRPFKLLYVSTVDLYKHQWHVIEAVRRLRAANFPLSLDLVGPSYPAGLRKLTRSLNLQQGRADMINYRGPVSYSELHELYGYADLKVFASSCESMPIVLLEAMTAGLPIACSRFGPMPEVLGDAGVYFDPEDPADIASALEKLIQSPELRARNAELGFRRAQAYSWERCASETFAFLVENARMSRGRY